MKLKFVGPKPLISATGIEFDNNKEDKHVYINIAVQLLRALDHDYIDNKLYIYNVNNSRFTDAQLLEAVQHYRPKVIELAEERQKFVEKQVANDLQRARENTLLSDIDKEVLINNLNIMKAYRIQRSINKTIYYCAIDALAELVKKDHIDFIVAPMFQKFAHVFHSVQGVLHEQKFPIDTDIEIYEEAGKLLIKLKVMSH